MNSERNTYRNYKLAGIIRTFLALLLITIVIGKPVRNAMVLVLQDQIELSDDDNYQEESEDETEKDDIEEGEEFEKTINDYSLQSMNINNIAFKGICHKFLFCKFSPRVVLPPPELALL